LAVADRRDAMAEIILAAGVELLEFSVTGREEDCDGQSMRGVRQVSPLTGNLRSTFLAMFAHPSAFASLVGRGGVAEKTVHDTGLSRVQRDVVLGGVL